MRDRKKRNIIIGSLCCLLVFMGIGYALLTQILTINGTATLTGSWNIKITGIETTEIVGSATNETTPTFTEDTATFSVGLKKPGDKIKYIVRVENLGSIDAVLSLNSSTIIPHKDIKFTNDLVSGEILYHAGVEGEENAGNKKSIREIEVWVEFNENATEITEEKISEYKIELTYTQYDGNSFYEPPKDVETDNGVFQVSADGTILNYNADLGTSVSIPAEVDGIPITAISSGAFREVTTEYIYDFKVILNSSYQPQYAVVLKEEVWDEALIMAIQAGLPESRVFLIGDPDIPALIEGELEGYYYMEGGITAQPIFPNEITRTISRLKINSLDLSNATNLEIIEDFAFSNASWDTLVNGDFEEGVTNLTFGNNTKDIEIGIAAFSGANLSHLKAPSTLLSGADGLTIPEDSEYAIKLLQESSAKLSLFSYSNIKQLIISTEGTNTEMVYNNREPGTANILPLYAGIERIDTLIISEKISGIADLVFNHSNIGTIKFPSSLRRIGDWAFEGAGLTNVVFNSGLFEIGKHAFEANQLTSVTIPSSITSIGFKAFYENPSLTTITVNKLASGVDLGDSWYHPTVTTVIYK